MDGKRFDQLTRFMGRGTSRRRALTTLAAGAVGGGALLAAATGAAAQTAPGERSVLALELLAVELAPAAGQNCDAVKKASDAFQVTYATLLKEADAEMVGLSQSERQAHIAAYGDRIAQASANLHAIATACGFAPNSTSAFTTADLDADTGRHATPVPPATAVASVAGGTGAMMETATYRLPGAPQPVVPEQAQTIFCNAPDCNGICNCLDAGSCTAMFFGCMAGSKAGCCYFGICVNKGICSQQCPNCIQM